MKAVKIILISALVLALALGLTMFLIGYYRPSPAGISVRANPDSTVYINGEIAGRTPYESTRNPGEIILKIVPDGKLPPYETRLNLIAGVKTVVKREFADKEEESSGEIVSFDKVTDNKDSAGLVVVSVPDNVQVELDGKSRGFSPVKLSQIVPGEHKLSVKAPGYLERALVIRTAAGYRLTIFIQLAKTKEEPKEEKKEEKYVEILDTPTGFLRVRSEPGSAGTEIDQIKPGDKFLLLGTDEETGWYNIQLEEPKAGLPDGRDGWISDEYATMSASISR